MKRWLSFMLLFGAMLGLLGQEAAFASAPAMPMAEFAIASTAMSNECADMMGLDKSQPDQPCKGMTLDCIAKMGCAIPLGVFTPNPLPAPADQRPHFAVPNPIARLIGWTVGPELEPPLYLG